MKAEGWSPLSKLPATFPLSSTISAHAAYNLFFYATSILIISFRLFIDLLSGINPPRFTTKISYDYLK